MGEQTTEKKVKDIMVPLYEFPMVSSDSTLRVTLKVLCDAWHPQAGKPKTGRRRVVVFENNEPIGTFGISEALKAIEPHFFKGITYVGMQLPSDWSVPIFWDGLLTERCQEVAGEKIKAHVTPFESFVDVNDTLLRAACALAKNKTDFLAVKSKGRLVGFVRNDDIFIVIAEMITEKPMAGAETAVYNQQVLA